MPVVTTADEYADFAARDARGVSPTYDRLASAVSRDGELLALLDTLPRPKRQPNLLFGVVRFLGGPVDDPAAFHDYAVAHWPAVADGGSGYGGHWLPRPAGGSSPPGTAARSAGCPPGPTARAGRTARSRSRPGRG